jgi:hypothetical protein
VDPRRPAWPFPPYFLVSFAAAFGSAGCGRRKVEAVAGAFLSAFGFFSSRPLPPRPLANAVLLFDPNCRRRYGVCFSALLVMAWPPADRSSPAPAAVWHAPSIGAIPIKARSVNAMERFLRMMISFVRSSNLGRVDFRRCTNAAWPTPTCARVNDGLCRNCSFVRIMEARSSLDEASTYAVARTQSIVPHEQSASVAGCELP